MGSESALSESGVCKSKSLGPAGNNLEGVGQPGLRADSPGQPLYPGAGEGQKSPVVNPSQHCLSNLGCPTDGSCSFQAALKLLVLGCGISSWQQEQRVSALQEAKDVHRAIQLFAKTAQHSKTAVLLIVYCVYCSICANAHFN